MVTHMLNFSVYSQRDFVHVLLHVVCQTRNSFDWRNEIKLSRNNGRIMEYFMKDIYERKDFTSHLAVSNWVTSFELDDCLDPFLCVFGIAVTTYNACEGQLEVERGDSIPVGEHHAFNIP